MSTDFMKLESEDVDGSCRHDQLARTVSLDEALDATMNRRDDPEMATMRVQEGLFLDTRIFRNLDVLHPPWEAATIPHFHALEFLIVLERCHRVGVQVFGVEAFSSDGYFLGVNIPNSAGDLPHVSFVKSLSGCDDVSFSATFGFEGVALDGALDEAGALSGSSSSTSAHLPQGTHMSTVLPQHLIDQYRAAHYQICDELEQFVLRVDEHSSRLEALYKQTGQSSAVFITGCNPCGEQSQEAQNLAAQDALLRELETLTQYIYAGVGEDPTGEWPGEPSWLALGIDHEYGRRLGEKFQQNALVCAGPDAIPRLILLR